jgi:glycosyltransferase involved in cell wall biosynthesis
MEENKRKYHVLVCPSDSYGVGLYRSRRPHEKLQQLYGDEFDVEINMQPNWADFASFEKYDLIHFHKGLFSDEGQKIFHEALKYFKAHNITTVMDIDDNWDVGQYHPLYLSNKAIKAPEKITTNFTLVDYVTTTTEIFANKIRKWNKNVYIFPNAIDPDEEQYQPIKYPSDRIRFGFVMGSSHERDMEQIKGLAEKLVGVGLQDKIQLVLCGYDLRGTITMVDKAGNPTGQRQIKPTESVWYRYEQNLTKDYTLISPEYKDFLLQFIPNSQYPGVRDEFYRREWTKDVNNFATHYRNIDVLLAPLDTNSFNEVKSELKFAEAGFTRTAVICSDYGPYTIGSHSLFKKGGEIDPEGNCILIDPRKAHKAWVKAIKKLADNPELIKMLQNNMYEHVKDIYDINKVTEKRAQWYKEIIKK